MCRPPGTRRSRCGTRVRGRTAFTEGAYRCGEWMPNQPIRQFYRICLRRPDTQAVGCSYGRGATNPERAFEYSVRMRYESSGRHHRICLRRQHAQGMECPYGRGATYAARAFECGEWSMISPSGDTIVSASWDSTLKVWDARKGEELRTLSGHTDWVTGCAISPSGDCIVSTSSDETLKVWDVHTGTCLRTLFVNGHLDACVWHPDGEHLIAVGDSGVYFLRWVR